MSADREVLSDRSARGKFTHVCLDCGALGTAGGYHDHGYENAGDTIPLSALPAVLRSFQSIETERDELRAEAERLRGALESLRTFTQYPGDDLTHQRIGEACGEDLCIVCLAYATATKALETPRPIDEEGSSGS